MEDNTFDFLNDFQSITYSPLPKLFEQETSQEVEHFVEIMHNGKRIYQCAQSGCGKTFKYKSEANRHLIIHQKGKPYSCSFVGCNKSFKRQETLEEHMRVHGGDLPFSCNESGCGRRFVSKPALRYHKLTHKNSREFMCDIEGCDKSFLTMSHLKQHQMSGLHSSRSPSDVSVPYKRFRSESESGLSESTLASPEKSLSSEYMQEMYELLQNTLAENQTLKERLKENEQSNISSDIEGQYSFQDAEPVSFSDIVNPSVFFDEYEMKVFEFLNENDKSDF